MNIFHPCLRMGCSKINTHLRNNLYVIEHMNLPDEGTQLRIYNFFFSFPLYDTIHTSLINTVQTVINVAVLTELLLFGSYNLSVEQNLIIIDAVHLFLNKSRQFLNEKCNQLTNSLLIHFNHFNHHIMFICKYLIQQKELI